MGPVTVEDPVLQATNANKQPVEHHGFYMRTGWLMGKLGRLVARMDLQEPLHIPSGRPILFAGNHRSFFDFVMTMAIFSREGISCRILIRASLFNNPFMGWFLRRWGAIPLSSRVREEAEDTAAEALAAGQMVAIMPEGKLMLASDRDGRKVGEPRPGVVHLARRTGAIILPVGFSNTDAAWPVGSPPWPKLGRRPLTKIRLGEPHEVGDGTPAEEAERIMAAIAAIVDD